MTIKINPKISGAKSIQKAKIEENFRQKMKDFYLFAFEENIPQYKITQITRQIETQKANELKKLNLLG